jgi:protein-export membrane protein SecD
MDGVRDVIERRVNMFGVAEPLIQIEGKDRLVIDLAGVKEVDQAIKMIGETPSLEFREETPRDQVAQAYKEQTGQDLPADATGPFFLYPSDLTGKDLLRGQADYSQGNGALREPIVRLEFNEEGKKKFADLTTRNVNKVIAIYLDGVSITAPRVNEPITDGNAVISGDFTIEEAKLLAKRLNAGALPVPIKLISQQTVGATLGADSLAKSLKAGLFGFLLIALFMVLYYRLPGLIAAVSLVIYTLIVVAIFNFLSITLTLAGIAGLILSIGMAVDANVLIFERMREELINGRSFKLAVEDGFSRAWPSIRDSNLTTLITAAALFWFGSGSIKGFAIALTIGILISMFSAITVTRNFLLLILSPKLEKYKQLF